MCDVPPFVSPERPFLLRVVDALDLAHSQIDEAEQLFCAGHDDAGMRSVGDACRTLEGIK